MVTLGNGITEADLTVHDETDDALAYILSRMFWPDYPVPGRRPAAGGAARCTTSWWPTRSSVARAQKGEGDLRELLFSSDTWTIS